MIGAEDRTLRRPRRTWLPWTLLATLGLLALAAAEYVAETARTRDQMRFDTAVEQIHVALRDRAESAIALLRATSGLFSAVDVVDRRLFHAYVEQLDLARRYPGLQGIGFSKRLGLGHEERLPLRMRDEGFPDFRQWPSHDGPERHAILYLEPLDARNRAAIGFDMSSDPVRRQAMERARDTGLAEATGKVELVQEITPDRQPGFLVFVPIYTGGGIPEAVEERRAGLEGYVYSPFRASDFVHAIFGGETPRNVQFSVYDGADVREQALLFRSEAEEEGGRSLPGTRRDFTAHTTLDMAGRVWTISFRSGPGFVHDPAWRWVPVVLLGGLLAASVLFLVSRAQVRARADAETLARENARLYRQAEAARAEAEVANRAKDEFLATLSHELRTPLNAMLGWTRILLREEVDEATARRGLEVIERNVQAQTRLIEDVLDVSRIITGKMHLSVRSVQMRGVIEAAVESVRPAAEARQITLDTSVPPGDTGLRGDVQRLQQVLWNLLSNAIKFTPPGGRIDVRLRRGGGQVEVEVADTGKGIPPAFLPHVFERFRQADSSSTRAHGGLGIGLALVRHLAELHGGTVAAHSEGEGRGTTFTLTLPTAGPAAATEDVAPVPAATVSRTSLESLPSLEGVRVLVVDDESDARELLGVILRGRGAEVETADSATSAMELFERARPDVVVSDISMPIEDGFELLRRVRAAEAGNGGALTPVIALTAYARDQDRRRAIAAGFQTHLAKPVEPDELVLTVASLVGRTGQPAPQASTVS